MVLWCLGVSREQWCADLQFCPCFDLGLVCAGFFEPVKCVEDCFPIVVRKIVLDLVDV